MMDLLLLAGAWGGWCVLHSGLISQRLTGRLRRSAPGLYRYHRLFYNAVAVATLVPVVRYGESLRAALWLESRGVVAVVQIVLQLAALGLFLAGARRDDLLRFLGIRQLRGEDAGRGLSAGGGLDTTGILAYTRHPWYLAGILLLWGNWQRGYDASAVVTSAVLTAYLSVGAHLEERKLLADLGEEYRRYQRRVPMFLPWF